MNLFVITVIATITATTAFAPSTSTPKTTVLNAQTMNRQAFLNTAAASLIAITPPANAIETYLTEPTEEFKESERQRMEFRKKQLELKAEFVKVLARLTGESSTEDQLVEDLTDLRQLVIITGGLPLGIKKEDMYKVIRSKKAKGFWPTNVEIA
mmetsp:Transcript_7963/g.16140  ORF Transcript_7963/g.16140 Transcript_7963/m.16140 type:complete len:154 (+) Transcript_7963:58-519(+)